MMFDDVQSHLAVLFVNQVGETKDPGCLCRLYWLTCFGRAGGAALDLFSAFYGPIPLFRILTIISPFCIALLVH